MIMHRTKEDYLKKNLVSKKGLKKMYLGLTIVFICVLFGAAGQIMLKNGITKLGGLELSEIFSLRLFTVLFNPWIFFGIALYAVSMILWLVALSSLDVSFIYPLISIGYIVTAVFAMIFLKEQVGILRWMGIFLIVGGSFLILRS